MAPKTRLSLFVASRSLSEVALQVLALLRGDVTVSYGQPNTASHKAHLGQRAKGWPRSNSETPQAEGATNQPPVLPNLDFGAPLSVEL